MNLKELTEIFHSLGADEPEQWAESEIEEGIPQLTRFLFLKGCWDCILPDEETSWIQNIIDNTPEDSDEPFSGSAHALRRLRAQGANEKDLTELVRGMQAELLQEITQVIDDPESVSGNEYRSWGLLEIDTEKQTYTRPVDGLHESVLETDPTGREMTPKES
jgi:hypothetical protein